MDRYLRCAIMLYMSLVLCACSTMRSTVLIEPPAAVSMAGASARTPIPGGTYTVRTGETLYSIAFRNGVDFRDLAQWNEIAAPYTIWPGQHLRLSPSRQLAAASTRPPVATTSAPIPSPAAPRGSSPGAAAGMFEPVTAPAQHATPAAATVAPTPAPGANANTQPSPSPSLLAPAVASAATSSAPVAGVQPLPPSAVEAHAAVAPVPKASVHAAGELMWRWPADGSVVKRFQSGEAIPGIEISGQPGDPVRAAADGVVVYSGNGLVGYGELVIIKHSDSLLSAYAHNRKRLVQEGQRVTAGQQIAEMGSTGTTRTGLGFQIRKDGNPVDPMDYLPVR
ncbi:MAG: peptidoglycan DD-metalloendopeptidase family protein [Rhodanobacter sp.]